ncbi:BaiN/RdsA family NAD(P)/FAD-dependent oxidoreductase [Clostridium guangxiense]|uniref:NAD(P)/FAD-dependent oxidoreductase n=1 Tax=Clostridium guangxiense TaxID=1662055 RepID=UPI001E33BE72|nr:NAD(P)/FAD-dependent oxidoreductase [Clostridium guangxiense]MCD2346394.1 NAD(P)/FAD-dependent oxidoreductase [Clostridium guangxiense]
MKVIVIGGGAAGITAAISAKDSGYDVSIIERNDRIGKKILITGNGRCNITNENINEARYHSQNNGFFKYALDKFNKDSTIDFFSMLGLPLTTLESGKMYPMSLQASSVLDILRLALEDRDIPVHTNSKVIKIEKSKNTFKIYDSNDKLYECDKVILACGGKSAPKTGSDGFGFKLGTNMGHSIVTPLPAIVQLKLVHNSLRALSGIRFDANTKIFVSDELERTEFGEILFTDYGISGPAILQLSRIASIGIEKNNNVVLQVDILPNIEENKIQEFFENHWGMFYYRSVFDSLVGVIHKKLIPILLKEANISNIHKQCCDLTWEEKSNIVSLLKKWNFVVSGTNSFENSQVTAGGINTREVDEKTLQSKLVSGLYFCGEILDVDGDCGGFNLQWAWSSGFLAGQVK